MSSIPTLARLGAAVLLLVGAAMAFEAAEHEYLGNEAFARWKAAPDTGYAGTADVTLPNSLTFTYGAMVANAGDFLGDPDHPISSDSNPTTRFQTLWDSFLKATGPHKNIKAEWPLIADVRTRESQMARGLAVENLEQNAYDGEFGRNVLQDYARITSDPMRKVPTPEADRGWTNFLKDAVVNGKSRFMNLAQTNWDHFAPRRRARIAYMTLHKHACKRAIEAAKLDDDDAKLKKWHEALAINGWADHFLSDLFASGHLRVYREDLHNANACGSKKFGDLLAKCMHDEDNSMGLYVYNTRGDSWKAYGDGHLFNGNAATNKGFAIEALKHSLDDLSQCYKEKAEPGSIGGVPLSVAPVALGSANHEPMFKLVKPLLGSKEIMVARYPINNPHWFVYRRLDDCLDIGLACKQQSEILQYLAQAEPKLKTSKEPAPFDEKKADKYENALAKSGELRDVNPMNGQIEEDTSRTAIKEGDAEENGWQFMKESKDGPDMDNTDQRKHEAEINPKNVIADNGSIQPSSAPTSAAAL